MKTLIITLLTAASIMITANLCYSQVGIGTKTPDANSVLDVNSNTTTTTLTVDKDGNTRIGDVAAGNTTYIEADGSLSYEGTATRWDDLKVPVSSIYALVGQWWNASLEATAAWGAFLGGTQLIWFNDISNAANENEVYFTVQMPHGWKEGTNIFPHVHWTNKVAPGAERVNWALEYTWADPGEAFVDGSGSIITGTAVPTGDGSIAQYEHAITPLGTGGIDATGKTLSSMLICRLFRNSSAGADTYNGESAALLEIDFHYQVDADGSRQEYIK